MKKKLFKPVFVLFLVFYIVNNSYSQYNRDWFRTYSNPTGDGTEATASCMDQNANLYLVSSCYNGIPGSDIFLMKYDALGFLQWQNSISSLSQPYYDRPADIKISPSGHIYLLLSAMYNYSRLLKFDLNGNILWNIVDSTFSVCPYKMDFDNDENIVVTGQYKDSIGWFHSMLVKYDTLGNVIWRTQSLAQNDNGYSVILFDSLNNIYTTIGNTLSKYSSSGTELWSSVLGIGTVMKMVFGPQNKLYLIGGPAMMQISKYDTSGTLLWSDSYGPGFGDASSIVFDNLGNFYVTGITNVTMNPYQLDNSVLLKYSSNGSLLWSKELNGTATVGLNCSSGSSAGIANFDTDHFLLYGKLFNETTLDDAFIAKIDTAGNILWQDIFDSNAVNHICETWGTLYFDNDSNIYLVGALGAALNSAAYNVSIMKYNKGYTGQHPSIQGNLYHDNNQNCIKDTVDFTLQGKMMTLMDSTYNILNYALTDTGGNYYFYAPEGHYIIALVPPQYWLSTCNGGLNVTLQSNTDSSYNNNLGIYMQPDVRDLSISVAGGIIRPAQNTNYMVFTENQGTDTVSGSITIKHDSALNYVNASPLPDSIFPNRLVWNYTDFQCGQSRQIHFTLQANANLTMFTPIENMYAIIDPITSDLNPSDNVDSLQQFLFGPYDPNNKTVNLKDTFYFNDSTFTYLIQFQNLGNDTAFNVVLRDTISNNLLLNTLNMGASSFPFSARFIGRVMFISFNGISMPPKSVNETGSQGFIKYSIRRKPNITPGSKITNNAAIYFDYMPAVITNETVNILYTVPNNIVNIMQNEQLIIYPNPTSNFITFENPSSIKETFTLSLTNIQGQLLFSEKAEIDNTHTLDLSKFPNGIYFLTLQNEKENYVSKVVVQR